MNPTDRNTQEPPTVDPMTGADAKPRNGKKRSWILPALLGVIVLAALAYGIYWLLIARWYETTDDAYVQGDMVSLAPQVSGTVIALNTALTQFVHRGDVLLRLDDTDAKVGLNKAEANLAESVRSAAQLFQTTAGDAVVVKKRRVLLEQARSDLARDRKLAPVNGVSKQALQHALVSYKGAQADLEQAQHQLAAARTATDNTSIVEHPQVKQAEARLRNAWVALARTHIVAPVSGYVAQKNVQVGQQATPGTPLLQVVPLQDVYVDANFKENQLGRIRIGQPVTLTSDLYGSNVTFHGSVLGFSSGTGAAFAVLPAQNASGNWIKVVQRLPVRIGLDPKELEKHPLLVGLSMQVAVDVHHSAGRMLSKTPTFSAVNTTDVYSRQSAGADAVIDRIVQENLPDADRTATLPPEHALKLSLHFQPPSTSVARRKRDGVRSGGHAAKSAPTGIASAN